MRIHVDKSNRRRKGYWSVRQFVLAFIEIYPRCLEATVCFDRALVLSAL